MMDFLGVFWPENSDPAPETEDETSSSDSESEDSEEEEEKGSGNENLGMVGEEVATDAAVSEGGPENGESDHKKDGGCGAGMSSEGGWVVVNL